jgi:hypothetical protein
MVPTDDISDLLAIGLTSVAGAITGRRTGPFQTCTVATESSNALLKLGGSERSLILRRDEPKLRSAEPIPDVLPQPRQVLGMHKQMRQAACRLRW